MQCDSDTPKASTNGSRSVANQPSVRVLVDLTRIRPKGEGGGIKPALVEMLRWLGSSQCPHAFRFVYAVPPDAAAEIRPLVRAADLLILDARPGPLLAAHLGCDLVYAPFTDTEFACPGIPTMTLVVDLVHREFPATLPEPDRIYREQIFSRATSVTDCFHVISRYTGDSLCRHYAVPRPRILRTYLPIHARLATQEAPGTEPGRPFFFFPANFWAHKNHAVLLKAYATYARMTAEARWPLVLSGHENPVTRALKLEAAKLGIGPDVRFAGYVSQRRLTELWTTAGALVFPSLHEGFGIPLVEAMAAGVPIIASRAAAIPEIAGDAALLVNASDPDELARAMLQVANSGALRDDLRARGRRRIRMFSIEKEFGRLADCMHTTARSSARWTQCGFHEIDGLAEELAIFALPRRTAPARLRVTTAPLGVERTLVVSCGGSRLATISVAASEPVSTTVRLPAAGRSLVLQVPDASRLSDTDPRSHGVVIESMKIQLANGAVFDPCRGAIQSPLQLDEETLETV